VDERIRVAFDHWRNSSGKMSAVRVHSTWEYVVAASWCPAAGPFDRHHILRVEVEVMSPCVVAAYALWVTRRSFSNCFTGIGNEAVKKKKSKVEKVNGRPSQSQHNVSVSEEMRSTT
jgi:hypothetical protein